MRREQEELAAAELDNVYSLTQHAEAKHAEEGKVSVSRHLNQFTGQPHKPWFDIGGEQQPPPGPTIGQYPWPILPGDERRCGAGEFGNVAAASGPDV